ncbi:MAG: nucleotidyltransferase substrate binding protein [Gammaproteobacteria bacterium]|nr:nucleotidyltransferase substrate binding protein [Gammaproteobacteria bacterium]MBU1653573.1 nucleotidyltransferase substrate binding protein [Gammaproteobacteria bacterium]MBU1961915.1 nucleotidyltransferase substrate binding protein [Gammaproteobacteria bacterium]
MSDQLSFEVLEKAIVALEDGMRDHEQYPQLLIVRDGVIQRFEIAMDLSRKLILRVLKEKFALDDVSANNKTFIREGARFGLIADAEAWMGHLEARNQTSNTYSAHLAERVFAKVPVFLPDARDLLMRLKDAVA